jgi:hypothetical protein
LVEGGGHTDIDINDCAHDGLDYVFYARRELGRAMAFPSSKTCRSARSYSARMEFAGVQEVTVGRQAPAGRSHQLYLRGPASDSNWRSSSNATPPARP